MSASRHRSQLTGPPRVHQPRVHQPRGQAPVSCSTAATPSQARLQDSSCSVCQQPRGLEYSLTQRELGARPQSWVKPGCSAGHFPDIICQNPNHATSPAPLPFLKGPAPKPGSFRRPPWGTPRAFLFVAACLPLSQFVQLTMLERHCLSRSPNAGGRQRLMPPRTNPTPHCCAPTEGSAQNLWPVLLQEARHFQIQGELTRHVGCENSHHRGWKVRGWAWQDGDKDDVTPSNSERSR